MSQPQPIPQGSGSSGCGCFGCCLGGCLGGFVMALIAAFVLPMVLVGIVKAYGPQIASHFGEQIMKAVKDRTSAPLALPAYVPAAPGMAEQVVDRVGRDFAAAKANATPFKAQASQDEINAVLRGWVKGQTDNPWARAFHDGMVTMEGGKLRTQFTLLGQGLADAIPAKIESTKPGETPADMTPIKNALAHGQYLNFDATMGVTRVGEITKIKIDKLSVFGYEGNPELELEITGQELPQGQVEKPDNAPIRLPGFHGMSVGPAGLEVEFDPKKLSDFWAKAMAEAEKESQEKGAGGSD